MSTAENTIVLDSSAWHWRKVLITGPIGESYPSVEEETESINLTFVALRPDFIKRHYDITAFLSIVTGTTLVVLLIVGQYFAALVALPFFLGFLNQYNSLRKDLRRVIS